VAGHIFQARLVWIYTQSNITNIIEVVVLKNNLFWRAFGHQTVVFYRYKTDENSELTVHTNLGCVTS
jgi:hypothetical protein